MHKIYQTQRRAKEGESETDVQRQTDRGSHKVRSPSKTKTRVRGREERLSDQREGWGGERDTDFEHLPMMR